MELGFTHSPWHLQLGISQEVCHPIPHIPPLPLGSLNPCQGHGNGDCKARPFSSKSDRKESLVTCQAWALHLNFFRISFLLKYNVQKSTQVIGVVL